MSSTLEMGSMCVCIHTHTSHTHNNNESGGDDDVRNGDASLFSLTPALRDAGEGIRNLRSILNYIESSKLDWAT